MEIWSKCDICGRDIPVGELCYGLKKGNCICKNCCTGFENCTFTLAPAPTLTPPNEWVNVEDRLPEESDGMVLFTNGKAVTSGYRNHMFRMSGEEGVYAPAIRKGGGYMRVTHWMPLPAPPDKDNNIPVKAPNEPLTSGFDVVDTKTGEYPDLWGIALTEDWAKHLIYCDMEGFAIEEDGTLLLLDECGKYAYCPRGRFEIRRPPEGEA